MANEEKELYKFVNDPKYRSKVIAKIHKNSDNAYNKRIKKIEHERDALSKKRTREITRIANDRWERLPYRMLFYKNRAGSQMKNLPL